MDEREQMGLKERKAAMRAAVQAQVDALADGYLQESDAAITAALLARPELAAAGTVFCYVSMGREPDTRALIEELLRAGKTVCVPRCLGGGVMETRRIDSFDALHPAPFGLLEPGEDSPLVPPEGIELVVAPCVAADKNGGRLGHGAGYYDRFLAKVRCPVVCLCRGALLQEEVPAGPRDVVMDLVLTEEGAWPQGGI